MNQVNEGFKAKERGLRRCEGYMYRGKGSAKLDRALGSLQSARAKHARNNMLMIRYIESLESWSDSHDSGSGSTGSTSDSGDRTNLLCLYNEQCFLR